MPDEDVFPTALRSQGLWKAYSLLSPNLPKPSTDACSPALQAQPRQPQPFLSKEQDPAGNRAESSKATLLSRVPSQGSSSSHPPHHRDPGGTDAARLAPSSPALILGGWESAWLGKRHRAAEPHHLPELPCARTLCLPEKARAEAPGLLSAPRGTSPARSRGLPVHADPERQGQGCLRPPATAFYIKENKGEQLPQTPLPRRPPHRRGRAICSLLSQQNVLR